MGIIGTFEGSASNPLWLYDGNNKTNGWISGVTTNSGQSAGGDPYADDMSLSIGPVSQNATVWCLGRYSNGIILTSYKTLHLMITTYYSASSGSTQLIARAGVGSTSMSGNSFSSAVDLSLNQSGGHFVNDVTYNINISSLSGTYCVYMYAYLQAPTKSRQVKLIIGKAWLD